MKMLMAANFGEREVWMHEENERELTGSLGVLRPNREWRGGRERVVLRGENGGTRCLPLIFLNEESKSL